MMRVCFTDLFLPIPRGVTALWPTGILKLMAARHERRCAMVAQRVKETVAMAMIGDGVLALLEPERHCRLWELGPRGLRQGVRWCAEHPAATRLVGALELGLGIWLGSRQQGTGPRRELDRAEKALAEPARPAAAG